MYFYKLNEFLKIVIDKCWENKTNIRILVFSLGKKNVTNNYSMCR